MTTREVKCPICDHGKVKIKNHYEICKWCKNGKVVEIIEEQESSAGKE